MRIRDAIDRADAVKPNTYGINEKVRWLSYLDGIILTETTDSHEDTEERKLTEYDSDHLDTELAAPYPYDELYVTYLKMKIDEENGETERYNNSATIFNSLYANYVKAYHRDHKPAVRHIRYR